MHGYRSPTHFAPYLALTPTLFHTHMNTQTWVQKHAHLHDLLEVTS